MFGCKCYVLNNGKENIRKFDEKVDVGIFLGYSLSSHAYRVYNKRLTTIEESIHVVFDETNHAKEESQRTYAERDEQNIILNNLENCAEKQSIVFEKQSVESLQQDELPQECRIPRVENIIGQIQKGVSTRRNVSNYYKHMAFVSQIEPKSIGEALKDENWVAAMHEELNQFIRNDVWYLVPKIDQMNIIGTKWVFRNKLD